ncbi:hypothetical protein [Vulcanisaeta distributa]|uniref:hypothetical protein n=1 Tax=Vulcanisaeta distributa TaxID=164451 RepID=UPI0006D2A846|nr:hypothetical protein [Vulcanisaeta distributa]
MPSRAIGMGMCPRCGKPGTVVIKAGNYVYIKHGNTWHYIGTIDKVNLNKILIKDEKMLEKIKENNIKYNYKYIRNRKIKISLITLTIFLVITFSLVYYFMVHNDGKKISTNIALTGCRYVKSINDTAFFILCNSTNVGISNNFNIKYINNLTNYNISINYFNYSK